MNTTPRAGGGSVRVTSLRRFALSALTLALSLTLAPGPLHGQDPVSGWWSARVQDAGSAPEVVFVLQAEGRRVIGRRIRVGADPVPVSGEHRADSLHLRFSVPEGSSRVPVDIWARVAGDRLTGVWRVALPGGQEVERRWVAVRTRRGGPPQ